MSPLTYADRLNALLETKARQTEFKQKRGPMDHDDHGSVFTDEPIVFDMEPNHPSGTFLGPFGCGRNFRKLMEVHPAYVDPMASLAGAWMAMLRGRNKTGWHPDYPFTHLVPEQHQYNIIHGIGGPQHFAPDMTIGFALGWGGLLRKVRFCREHNTDAQPGFYDGLEEAILGVQNWIGRLADTAESMALTEPRPELRGNLASTVAMCRKLVNDPPETFREACQFIACFEIVARCYNGSGAMGQLDELLRPYYERDIAAGILDDEEAIFHLACLLIKDPHYSQLGGPGPDGRDQTSRVSFLILEAMHAIRIPTNLAVHVHDGLDPKLFDLAIKYLFEDGVGHPLFVGDKGLTEGFCRNGYPVELARQRVKTGCHWCAIPGREYTLNDIVKLNFAAVFDTALREMLADTSVQPTTVDLWRRFEEHLRRAVDVTAEGIDWHLRYMPEFFPELVLDLFCHGPVEKGRDASDAPHQGVEFYNLCIDGSALATAADSFAAVEQRVEKEKRLAWHELLHHLDTDFADAEDVRLMLKSIPRYGSGGSRADDYARRITQTFTRFVKAKPTPAGYNMIPGLFSWASTIPMGLAVGATPNGRHARAPISHGSNPDPGFVRDGAPTAMAIAVAAVQPGYGNTAPLQMDLDSTLGRTAADRAKIAALIKGHFDMGGTQININIIDKRMLLEAEKDPSKFPDLIVRVTGFSAYFASLSPEFRRWVIERVVQS